MTPLTAVVVLVATMVVAVVATMVVENWHRLVVRVPVGRAVTPDPATEPEPPEPPPEPEVEPPAAGRPEGALGQRPGTVVLRDRATADVLAALLFAAYASRRTSGADRASAWVTAAATPPGADPARFPPGVDLRARPSRVDELLSHTEGDAAWLTIQPTVDIARGVARTPVRQPVLAGLVMWWARSCLAPGVLEPDEVVAVRDAIGAVGPRLDRTPWGRPAHGLHRALCEAAAAGAGIRIEVVGAPRPAGARDADDHAGAHRGGVGPGATAAVGSGPASPRS